MSAASPRIRFSAVGPMVRCARWKVIFTLSLVATTLAVAGSCVPPSEGIYIFDPLHLYKSLSERVVLIISPPMNLQRTTDPSACAEHVPIPLFGGALCAAELATPNELMLIWDWQDAFAPLPL